MLFVSAVVQAPVPTGFGGTHRGASIPRLIIPNRWKALPPEIRGCKIPLRYDKIGGAKQTRRRL